MPAGHAQQSDEFAVWVGDADPICPKCGSGDLTALVSGGRKTAPVKCNACGHRMWMPDHPNGRKDWD